MALRLREKCKKVALELKDKTSLFVLGKGYGEPIGKQVVVAVITLQYLITLYDVAFEGALKIKEMAYIHAEGYSGGALKHGPFALIEGRDGREVGDLPIIKTNAVIYSCIITRIHARLSKK